MYVIIAGAGLIGHEVTTRLVANKHDVVVIDKEQDVCESIYAETGAVAIQGSATDINTLERAGADKTDAILCLMRLASDNIACALIAKSLGIPRIIARLRDPRYEQAYRLAGVNTIVRMADLLINQILMEIEQPKVKKVMTLSGGKAEIYAVRLPEKAKSVGMTVKDIAQSKDFPKDCVFMGIYKEQGDFLIPRGNYTLQQLDTIFLVSTSQFIKQASDFLTRI